MFEWLQEELRSIKTPYFHVVDGPASAELRQAVETATIALPPSYKEFVLRFGNAKLYRYSSRYEVEVYAGPREAESQEGEPLIHFAKTGLGLAFFKEELLVPDGESPVFEWNGPELGWRRRAKTFEGWLRKQRVAGRRHFTKEQWEAVLAGPAPFNERELAIIAARRQFRWRIVGVAANGDVQFEVQNGSTLTLPVLSVGIRGRLLSPKNGPLEGGSEIPIASVPPGETRIVEKPCYKSLADPLSIEAFELPDPEPALRDLYGEFK